MTGVRGAATLAVVLALQTGACTTDPDASTGERNGALGVDVDVDTPELRSLKKQVGVATCEPGDPDAAPAAGGMPEVVLPCLGGGPDVNLATLRGPLVINLWAQWCGPCREELPYYQQLHERAGDEVGVLGIDYQDTQPAAALELLRETGVTFPQLADPAAAIRVPFRVRGLPGVVFVDRDGAVTHTEYVVVRSYAQLRDLVQEHLDVTV